MINYSILSLVACKHRAFSLAELLVVLALLGLIAASTIPKLMTGAFGKDRRYSYAIEAMGALQQVMDNYMSEESGEFISDVPLVTSGTTNYSVGDPPYERLVSYLENHLNSVRNYSVGGYRYFQFAGGDYTIRVPQIVTASWPEKQQVQFEISFKPSNYSNGNNYAADNITTAIGGVDSTRALVVYLPKVRVIQTYGVFARNHSFSAHPAQWSILDIHTNPDKTCSAVSGLNCQYAGF